MTLQPTVELFRHDSTLIECTAVVLAIDPTQGVVLDRTVCYPLGGGQAGDTGLLWCGNAPLAIADTRKHKGIDGAATGAIAHVLAAADYGRLAVGDAVRVSIDAPRRQRLMRFHTATHLLCHLVARPVDGCSITADTARLDFVMTEPLDKDALGAGLQRLVQEAWPVTVGQVSDAELHANPSLVKSMSVQPPRGSGHVRTIHIGQGSTLIDLQPCGGTHVSNTAQIGVVRVVKIEKKSAQTRRVVLALD
jgi:misacylated tRNA(Ala) deacylase